MINERVYGKMRKLRLDPEGFIAFFRQMVAEAEETGMPSMTLAIPLYEENDLAIGEFAPEIHLVIQRVVGCET